MNPVDMNRLQDFSDGSESGLRDLAALLVTHVEECLVAIRRGVAEKDGETIRSEAHRGAGTFGACGAGALSALLVRIETLAGARKVEEASALVPELEREAAQVRQFLAARFGAQAIAATKVEQ